MRKCAVVILYNFSSKQLKKNIESYINQVDSLILIDNSDDGGTRGSVFQDSRIIYYAFGENRGIAAALNQGFSIAIKLGYEWVLTFDQDSCAPKGIFDLMYAYLTNTNLENIGIVSPLVRFFPHYDVKGSADFKLVDSAISSGSLINVDSYKTVGGFNEELFIDLVDIEFCMRLRLNGYRIVELQSLVLEHRLGNSFQIKIFGRHVAFITNHNYIRRYYMTRNALWVSRHFRNSLPKECKKLSRTLFTDILKILLFESDKNIKLKAFRLGWKDAVDCHMGKLDDNRLRE